mgnify:CR=1 FL=1
MKEERADQLCFRQLMWLCPYRAPEEAHGNGFWKVKRKDGTTAFIGSHDEASSHYQALVTNWYRTMGALTPIE